MKRLAFMSVASLCAVVCGALPCFAEDEAFQPNEGHWRMALQQQLKAEQGCSLNEVLTVQEVPLGDDVGQDGRASCFDGREFNFTRKGKNQPFKIEACAPSVC